MTWVLAGVNLLKLKYKQTSLMRKLQAQTLPYAIPWIGEIHQFCKTAVTLNL